MMEWNKWYTWAIVAADLWQYVLPVIEYDALEY